MKKKLLIFIAGLLVLGGIGYSSIVSAKTTEPVTQMWDFKGEQVDTIMLDAGTQDVKVELIDSESDTTTVELIGKVSSSVSDMLEEATVKDGNLILPLGTHGIQLMVTSEGKTPLTVRITTNLKQPFKKLDIDMIMGKVTVLVPEAYQGSYEAKIYQGDSKVLGVPDTTNDMTSLIRVSTADDILIHK